MPTYGSVSFENKMEEVITILTKDLDKIPRKHCSWFVILETDSRMKINEGKQISREHKN